MSDLAGDLGISVNTVKKWLSMLESGNIVYLLRPYYNNMGKRIVKSPKIYFLDIGLVCYLTGVETKEHILNGPMGGQLFENYIIQEIIKSYYNKGRTPSIYYLRTNNNLEVDLLIEKSNGITPVEIKLNRTPKFGMARNIHRFNDVFKNLNIANGYIVSLSEQNIMLSKSVSIITLWDLLEKLN